MSGNSNIALQTLIEKRKEFLTQRDEAIRGINEVDDAIRKIFPDYQLEPATKFTTVKSDAGNTVKGAGSTSVNLDNSVMIVFKEEKQFLSNKEITTLISDRFTEVRDALGDTLPNKLSHALSRLKKKNLLTNIRVGGSTHNTFWGSPRWLTNEGDIHPDYMYNESALTNSVIIDDIEL